MQSHQPNGNFRNFITHDLGIIAEMANCVAIMYAGQIVKQTDTETLFANPPHPYTQALMSAIPIPDPNRTRNRTILTGDVPSPLNPPSGCRFHPRCPIARLAHCSVEEPQLRELRPDHWVACHYAGDFL